MLRILKAFAWLRWRMLVNSLEKTGSRDALERFSIAIEKLGPILAAILLVPSALILAALGAGAGYSLADGSDTRLFIAVRYILLTVPLLAIIGPLFLPAADRTNPVRLLLLPIPRGVLYMAQASSALGDPWNILMVPLVASIPVGLAAGGALTAAVVCLALAALLIVVIIGIAALSTSLLHLLARDRRRGELLALLFIVIVPLIAMLPGALAGGGRRHPDQRRGSSLPAWVSSAGSRAQAAYPSEIFANGTGAAARGETGPATAAAAGLAASALILHGLGLVAFRRVLASPGTSGARRARPMRAAWNRRLPGLSSGASAVAFAQLRLALRTPRGRAILISPLAFFVIFGVMMYRSSGNMDFGPFHFASGLGLALFTSSMSLLSILPIAMNQFAVDRAGLTMTMLSPLTDGELLAGKAAGNGLVVAPPALVCIVAALLIFPGGSPALWISILFGLISAYLVFAPVAAICSAAFPRAVDMNSIGRGSNAHGAAGLIGLVSFAAGAAPPSLLVLLAITALDRPSLAPVLLAGWCVLAYAIGRLLFIPARRIYASRRENLATLV